MIRAFLALPVPEPFLHRLTIAQHTLRLVDPVDRDALHLTLAFLGEHPEPVLEDLHLALTARPLPLPVLRLEGLDVFGGETPRSLHARIAPDPRLSALHSRVTRAARDAGIALERRKFVPHITLARFAKGEASAPTLAAGIAAVGRLTSDPVVADQMILYRATLRRGGAVYDPLAEYALTA